MPDPLQPVADLARSLAPALALFEPLDGLGILFLSFLPLVPGVVLLILSRPGAPSTAERVNS